MYYNSHACFYLGKSCSHPTSFYNSTGVATSSIQKNTTGDRSHYFDGFSDGCLKLCYLFIMAMTPVIPDTIIIVSATFIFRFTLCPALSQHYVQHDTLHQNPLRAEWIISIPGEETEAGEDWARRSVRVGLSPRVPKSSYGSPNPQLQAA